MSRSPFRRLAAIVGGLALSVVVVFAADAAYGHRPAPATPAPTPSAAPVVKPTPAPVEPTAPPSQPSSGGDIAVPLKNLTGHDVSVAIDD
ncbi:MAG TPA: hypothetical protein VFN41_03625, partial [Candidatus Limnocylindrales bacterium]|nr:hypothetical protein [Candidatus Limnocylindrales bacterium]